jgi:hypothetical protein
MKKRYRNRRVLLSLVFVISMLLLTSCWHIQGIFAPGEENDPDRDFYEGEYPELYTVAINSLLGQRGFSFHSGPAIWDPNIRILEKDDFGRILFTYSEDPFPRVSTFNILISQTSDENYVYFLPHYNFLSYDAENRLLEGRWETYNGEQTLILEAVDVAAEEKIEELKILNDWNQPLDLEQAVRAPIIRRKEEGPLRDFELRFGYREALGDAARSGSHDAYTTFFKTDDYGRSIYLGIGLETGLELDEGWRAVIMLFQPDDSLDLEKGVMQLPDFQNYQSILRELKELNQWNQPLEE